MGFKVPKSKYPNCHKAHKYALDIRAGKIPSCEYVKLSVERYFKDIDSKKFYLDLDVAERVLTIIQLFKHVKGPLAGKPLIMPPWFLFIGLNVFGILNKKTGLRKYRQVYVEVSRKNSKTTYAIAIMNYLLCFDGIAGNEIFIAATKADQARIGFSIAVGQWNTSEKLKKLAGINCYKDSIFRSTDLSFMKPISNDYKSSDGFNVGGTLIDEYHAHKTSGMYQVLLTGMGSREQPILFIITTAGLDISGPCYKLREEIISILKGKQQDDSFFGIIYTLDKEDDYRDKKVWIKANPNLGLSVKTNYLEDMVSQANRSAASKAGILTKNFNVWQNAGVAFLQLQDLKKNYKANINWKKISENNQCFLGLDLSTKVDLTGLVKVYPVERNGVTKYYVWGTGYLPESRINSGENDSYADWKKDGWLKSTQGKTIDHDAIMSDIKDIVDKESPKELAYDPWNSTFFIKELNNKLGILQEDFYIEYGQTVRNFSSVLKTLEKLVLEKKLVYDSPVLEWCLLNLVVKVDFKENIFPRKAIPKNRIDLAIALLMALGRILYYEEEEQSAYAERELLIL